MSGVSVIHGSGFGGRALAVPGRHYTQSAPMLNSRCGEIRGKERLRLTRRGQVVLIGLPLMVLAALLLSLAGFVLSPAKASQGQELSVTPTVSVVVQPGSSLWGIAAAVAPERDPRDVVADIVELNNLVGGTVVPGQELFVPSGQR